MVRTDRVSGSVDGSPTSLQEPPGLDDEAGTPESRYRRTQLHRTQPGPLGEGVRAGGRPSHGLQDGIVDRTRSGIGGIDGERHRLGRRRPRGQAEEAQGADHVVDAAGRRCTIGQQAIGALRSRAPNRPRNGKDRPVPLQGGGDRVHGSATGMGLDDDQDMGERRDYPVPGRKAPTCGAGARWHLGDELPGGDHPVPQRPVGGRIDHVETRTHHAQRWSTTRDGQCPTVGSSVDAQRQAGDDDHAGGRQVPTQLDRTSDP